MADVTLTLEEAIAFLEGLHAGRMDRSAINEGVEKMKKVMDAESFEKLLEAMGQPGDPGGVLDDIDNEKRL